MMKPNHFSEHLNAPHRDQFDLQAKNDLGREALLKALILATNWPAFEVLGPSEVAFRDIFLRENPLFTAQIQLS